MMLINHYKLKIQHSSDITSESYLPRCIMGRPAYQDGTGDASLITHLDERTPTRDVSRGSFLKCLVLIHHAAVFRGG